MKTNMNIIKNISILTASALLVCSCIKETFPEGSTATAEQVSESASALNAAVNGIPSQMAQGYLIYGEQESELDMAIPGLFIAFSECTGELFPLGDAGYDHYQRYNTCQSVGKTTYRSYVPWRTLYILVKSANDVIGTCKETTETNRKYKGMGYAYRAYFYWMLMNMYEPVLNEYTDCSDVYGLTVPIVTDTTSESRAGNNPRVQHDEMVKFILRDLDSAEVCLEGVGIPSDRLMPSLPVVYGLKARTYMSDGQYDKAAEYAQAAIDEAGSDCTPLTQSEWEDVNTGFNTANHAWMWKIKYDAENMGNLCNWIGWMSAEADWGYASLTGPGIDAGTYNSIPDSDFRKHSWLDPDKMNFYEYKSTRGEKWITNAPDYTSIKFRPLNGDWENYSVGGAVDVPLMRIEEMYYIVAEAEGMKVLQNGIDKLEEFVQKYRNPEYSCSAANVDAFESEILFQKKVEFWGEGIAFFDAKRMRAGVKQSYAGTNAPGDNFKLNCNIIKPNWNFVIPESEESSNTAIVGKNNPDPSGTVEPDLRY